ncbi:Uncharacterised protein [Vibrio cholerae]|nr:Uncharacterised protein [Vibrio cholerae]
MTLSRERSWPKRCQPDLKEHGWMTHPKPIKRNRSQTLRRKWPMNDTHREIYRQ